jgi:hypothetical protein
VSYSDRIVDEGEFVPIRGALDTGEFSASRPVRLTLLYPLDKRLDGPWSRLGRSEEVRILAFPG